MRTKNKKFIWDGVIDRKKKFNKKTSKEHNNELDNFNEYVLSCKNIFLRYGKVNYPINFIEDEIQEWLAHFSAYPELCEPNELETLKNGYRYLRLKNGERSRYVNNVSNGHR